MVFDQLAALKRILRARTEREQELLAKLAAAEQALAIANDQLAELASDADAEIVALTTQRDQAQARADSAAAEAEALRLQLQEESEEDADIEALLTQELAALDGTAQPPDTEGVI